MIQELAVCFGSDLVVDGDIYYSDRVQKDPVFYAEFDRVGDGCYLAKQYALQRLRYIYTSVTKLTRKEVEHYLIWRRCYRCPRKTARTFV